jgi:hypothetical protein
VRESHSTFITKQFLRSNWELDYQAFQDSDEERELLERLHRWSSRADLGERSAEPAFLDEFFRQTWGYAQAGQAGGEGSFSLYPQFPVASAGARGGSGTADAALGWFDEAALPHVPQVLCEFKDIRSTLDAPQRRKGNTRSPVRQGLDYLTASRRGMFGHEPILPLWAIISDMNEFRLYWHDRGDRQFLQFTIRRTDLFSGLSLLDGSDEARFDRFLFARVFHRQTLIVEGGPGRPLLNQLIQQQRFRQRELENTFYEEYRAYRERLYEVLLEHNGEGTGRFPGTRGRLVRLAQKIIDRCIFVFFCEDMGRVLGFPPQLLRNFLSSRADDQYFDRLGGAIWEQLCGLFRAMNDGTAFGGEPLNQFNGGLFAPDPDLERLHIPNYIFCERGQGQNEASLHREMLTLLYLSAAYNYAAGWSGSGLAGARQTVDAARSHPARSLGLYTLGRIFEQSITELEILEAEADGRPSLNVELKRKRDGVYYTPEWVVDRIVAETLGRRLGDLKAVCGWPEADSNQLPTEEAIGAYEEALTELRIVDPACGSGAFLITALRYLLDEWRALQGIRQQVTRNYTIREGFEDRVVRDVLRRNLYGVDINPASVEITKLALWLHTARGDRPLSSLDEHIRDGNSLIGPEFYEGLAPYSADEQERINTFDWEGAFPEVFARGGFDAVVSNPPYVKLQNYRRVHADMAAFLRRAPGDGGRYASTQTGNFDIFLPFIEKGIRLLKENGQLGYIAPSLWTVNEYGQGLRDWILEGRYLWGWIDFGSFQVFDEATTYTALQFFSKRPNDAVKVTGSPDGVIPEDPWAGNDASLPFVNIRFGDRWLLATGADRDLIDRLYRRCRRLDDPRLTRHIYQGLITSADPIYHLKRLRPNRYCCTPKGRDAPPSYEVQIEDAIMKPLVSGPEAKRYVEPETNTYLLFPYRVDQEGAHLIPPDEMAAQFPLAWAYLRSWEAKLREREAGAFDDDQWYRFGRHQNLDKQEVEKLIVPRLVSSVSCSVNSIGGVYLDNVDVGGVVPARGISPYFLAGVLNAPVADFVFRRISKPFRGDYRSANKQFIAPLPIPPASEEERSRIAESAEHLQALHTRRRNTLGDIARRRTVLRVRSKPENWLFPDLPSLRDLSRQAPQRLDAEARAQWANERHAEALRAHNDALGANIRPGVAMAAELENGELRFFVDGAPAVDRVFVNDEEGPFIAAQWKLLAATFSVTPTTDGKKLSAALRKLSVSDNLAAVQQIIDLQRRLTVLETEIADAERELNALLYRLYDLSPEDIRLVEA